MKQYRQYVPVQARRFYAFMEENTESEAKRPPRRKPKREKVDPWLLEDTTDEPCIGKGLVYGCGWEVRSIYLLEKKVLIPSGIPVLVYGHEPAIMAPFCRSCALLMYHEVFQYKTTAAWFLLASSNERHTRSMAVYRMKASAKALKEAIKERLQKAEDWWQEHHSRVTTVEVRLPGPIPALPNATYIDFTDSLYRTFKIHSYET